MNLLKTLLLGAFVTLALTLSGCGEDNSDVAAASSGTTSPTTPEVLPEVIPEVGDVETPNITMVLPVTSTELTINNQVVDIEVRVFDSANNPYSTGNIVKINPSDVLTGRDIGTFDTIESPLTNGVAHFTYTAPDSLEADTSSITFAFYHDSNSSNARSYTMSIVPEINQTILTNYALQRSNKEDVTMELNSSKIIAFTVYDASSNQLADSSITSISVTSLNPSIGTLKDNFGNTGSSLTVSDKNSVSMNLVSNTYSGLIPIKVEAKFTDANGDSATLTEVFDVVVHSGPATTMSLSYAGTDNKSEYAKFVENWVLTVTDKYNNVVNTNPAISMGMITGYAKSNAATTNSAGYLYYDKFTGNTGTLTNASPYDIFTAANGPFLAANIDVYHDYLVTFGDGYTYNASGKWDISAITSPTVLDLVDDFNGTSTSTLGFAVGHNYRLNTCNYGEEVANVYPRNNNYILEDTGSMVVQVEYDYYLTGKKTLVWVNLVGDHNGETLKLGEVQPINLRGKGLEGDSFSFAKGYTGTQRLNINIADTVEYYRNANFSYIPKFTGDDVNITISGTSMDNGITSCVNNGVGYVDVTITPAAPNAGSVDLTDVLVTSEF